MRIRINGTDVVIPSSLSEFTLGQRIQFNNQYGKELDAMAKSIIEMEHGFEKDLEATHFHFEKMFRTIAFFTGFTVEALRQSEFVDDIARIYQSSLQVLFEDEQQVELKTEYVWKNEIWELHPPELKNGSRMTFGEFIDAKQMIQNMIELGADKWEYMLPLCAIYLRKKGDVYQEEFSYEDSDRRKLMEDLPMDIVMAVGFFFDQFNEFLNKYFEIFGASKIKSAGRFSKQHFIKWGWVNFLKEIAKTKVFDIAGSGKNSIDCARDARLFDVLVYASEEKNMNEAQYMDFEAERSKHK